MGRRSNQIPKGRRSAVYPADLERRVYRPFSSSLNMYLMAGL
jgi:hypothetical protein